MTNPVPHTRDTLGTIRRNAGKLPAAQLAEELGWSLSRLERVARDNGYDLKCRPQDEPSPTWLTVVSRSQTLNPNTRCVSVNVLLYPADVAALDIVARDNGIRRSRVISRLVENARAHGVLPDLARRPAPRAKADAEHRQSEVTDR